MNNTVKYIFAFSLGAVVGAIVTREVLARRHEQEEIIEAEYEETDEKDEEEEEESDEYHEVLKSEGYVNYSGGKKDNKNQAVRPYVITPEEFGEIDEYRTASLFYHADKVLATTEGKIINDDDADIIVGLSSLTTFGEYEPDSVFVRNEILMTDYEILLDCKPYAEANYDKSMDEDE